MFISTKEKDFLVNKISSLESSVSALYTALRLVEQKLNAGTSTPKPAKKKKPLSEAQKAKQRIYAKAYAMRKKAEKAALIAQAVA
jgi:hypothetical protein